MVRGATLPLSTTQAPFSKGGSSVQVHTVTSEAIQLQEGVAIASYSMTQTVTLQEQASLPHHFATAQGCCQVLLLAKYLEKQLLSSNLSSLALTHSVRMS